MSSPLTANPPDFGYGPQKFNYVPPDDKIWREADLVLPAFPEDAQLVSVPMPASDTHKVSVDKRSLASGTDGVLRFTLVVESSSGARNVFFDGIRCTTREYKTYAIGTSDRKFQALKHAQWQFITSTAYNNYRHVLYRQYACTQHDSPRTPQEFLAALN